MAFRERPTRAGLQITLEPRCRLLVREFHRDEHFPWPVLHRVPGRSRVVPRTAFVHVRRPADVVALRLDFAAKDINESRAEATHAESLSHGTGRRKAQGFLK